MENEKRYEVLRNNLKGFLDDGETVLWHGWAEPCDFLAEEEKPRIVKSWIAECAVFGAILIFYMTMAAEVNYLVAGLILAVWVIVLMAPYREWRKLKEQQYWITTRRIISGRGKNEFWAIDMDLVDAVEVKKLPAGHDCVLLCEKVVKQGEKLMRWRSGSPSEGTMAGDVGMVFYNIVRAEEALDAIRRVKGTI